MLRLKKFIYHSMFLSAMIHSIRFIFKKKYREKRSFLAVRGKFFYFYGRLLAGLFFPILKPLALFLRNKNIYISVHNISAVGHIFPEIDLLIRKIESNVWDDDAVIWYVMPSDPLLFELRPVFENRRLTIKLNGFLHLVMNLALLIDNRQAICVSQSSYNYINALKPLSVHDVFSRRQYNRAAVISQEPIYFPIRRWGYNQVAPFIPELLGVKKKYVVLQIKDKAVNGTFQPVNPQTYLLGLEWLGSVGYDIVFAGREKMPDCFSKFNVINYSESTYACPVNDYMLVAKASFVLGSASGFVMISELLDVPLLSINSWQPISYVGKKTVLIPTLLRRFGETLSFEDQRKYALGAQPLGYGNLPSDKSSYEALDASDSDILEALREIDERIRLDDWGYSGLQKKIKESSVHTMLGIGLSRISNDFLVRNEGIFFES